MVDYLRDSGVRAVVVDYDTFMRQMGNMNKKVAEFGKETRSVGQQAATAGGGIGKLGAMAAGAAGGGIALLGAGIVSLVMGLGTNLVQAAGAAASAIQSLAISGIYMAGRFQEMEFAAKAVGQALGKTQDEVQATIMTITEAGIRYDIAAASAMQLMRNQIALAHSTDLARIAQATAVITGEDSSQTFQRLIWAVSTGNTEMLRYMNIEVNKQRVEEQGIKLYNKRIEQLTKAELMEARVSAVIEEAANVLGVYDAAMDSPTKKLRSLQGRVLPTLSATIMQSFLPAWKTAIDGVYDFAKALTAAFEEGGALYPIMIQLGAVASLVADAFKAALEWITEFVTGLDLTLAEGLTSTIENMFIWGAEMVGSLAEGIIEAASTVLVAAMNYVGEMLASWLAPGSPPKVAPEIDQWGLETINEWLHGMTRADFGILQQIQSSLRAFFDPGEMRTLGAQVSEALSTGMELSAEVYDSIRKAAGEFGDEIALLVEYEMDLARATQRVQEAQEALNAAWQSVADAQGDVRRLTDEYNDLLVAGASDEVLKAKLAEINAAEEQRDVAADQVGEAAAVVREQEAALKPLQEQAKLQEMLLQQLQAMALASKEVAKAARVVAPKPKVGKADLPILGMPDTEGISEEISNRIKEAIELAKGKLKAALTGIWDDVWLKLAPHVEGIEASLVSLGEAWDAFSTNASEAVSAVSKDVEKDMGKVKVWFTKNWPIIQAVAETAWIVIQDTVLSFVGVFTEEVWPSLQAAFENIEDALGVFGITWKDVWDAVKLAVSTVGMAIGAIFLFLISAVAGLANAFATWVEFITGIWVEMAANIKGVIESFIRIIVGWWEVIAGIFTGDFPRALNGLLNVFRGTFDMLVGMFTQVWLAIKGIFGSIIMAFYGFGEGIYRFFEGLYNRLVGRSIIPDMLAAIYNSFATWFDYIVTLVGGKIQAVITALTEKVEAFIQAGRDLIQGIIDGIKEKADEVIQIVTTMVEDAIQAAKDALLARSRSRKFEDLGGEIGAGLSAGLEAASSEVTASVEALIQSVFVPFQEWLAVMLPAAVTVLGESITNLVNYRFVALRSYIAGQLIPILRSLHQIISGKSNSITAGLMELNQFLMEEFIGETLPSLYRYIKKYLLWAFDQLIVRVEHLGEALITIARVLLEMYYYWKRMITAIEESVGAAAPYMGESPSPFEKSLTGIGDKLSQLATAEIMQFAGSMQMATQAVAPVVATAPSVMRQSSLSFGDVYLQDEMDWQLLKTRVLRWVGEEMG